MNKTKFTKFLKSRFIQICNILTSKWARFYVGHCVVQKCVKRVSNEALCISVYPAFSIRKQIFSPSQESSFSDKI
jgi:hypothetical protein